MTTQNNINHQMKNSKKRGWLATLGGFAKWGKWKIGLLLSIENYK
ncbi:hypothetical protein [Amylibacter sp. SFDW26]|nr:hypothetical protein [Amylibacter sp. SFDW26]